MKNFTSRINLTRSKTEIISIPGKPSVLKNVDNSDCDCEACIKCATFNQQSLDDQGQLPKGESQRDEATKARMFEIYETFDKLDYQTGIYDNTQSFVETSTTAPRKNATTAIRYVIV